MATVISCGVCKYPVTFRGIAPDIMGEKEHEFTCPNCRTMYAINIRMTKGPEVPAKVVEVIKNKPSV